MGPGKTFHEIFEVGRRKRVNHFMILRSRPDAILITRYNDFRNFI